MPAQNERSVIRQFPRVGCVRRLSNLRTTTRKSIEHLNGRNGVVSVRLPVLVFKLEASLIDDGLVDDRCFRQVDLVFCIFSIVRTRR